jgi:hypothetical protein
MAKTITGLSAIQATLKAPKDIYNSFGKYNYRSCESILEAVKPLLAAHSCTMTISDEIVAIGDRIYVKATVTFADPAVDGMTVVHAYAREAESKKGMDSAQVTGATSSYARKYALNGLFLIDDTKDSDVPTDQKAGHVDTPDFISDKEVQELLDLIKKFSVEEPKFCLAMKVPTIDRIPANQFAFCKQALEKKGQQQEKK